MAQSKYNDIHLSRLPMHYFRTLIDSFAKWPVWTALALNEIKMSYKRSMLGPLWLTLTMAIRIYSMGYLYSHLFHSNVMQYLPYIAAGMICWELISKLISDGPMVFISSEHLMKNLPLQPTIYILQMMTNNFLIFFHYLIAYFPVILFFNVPINVNTLLFIPGILLIMINVILYCSILGMLGVRFRDIPPIIQSIMRVAFFLTPVLWMPDHLSKKFQILIALNPLEQFLDLLRYPLLGKGYGIHQLELVLLVTVVGFFLYLLIYIPKEKRIVFWT